MATEVGTSVEIDPKTERRLGRKDWWKLLGFPWGGDRQTLSLNEEGETVVLEAGRKCKVVARNALKEVCRASLAVARGQIFIRSDEHLYAIGSRAAAHLSASSDGGNLPKD